MLPIALNKSMNKTQLRLVLALFLIALAIPTLILIQQAYRQLKWEAFHQHSILAEELSARIDNRLVELIAKEEARSFGDYAFLVIAGDPAANFLQRSPLSVYPVTSDIPGLIGYFQIDAADTFSTPLLPQTAGNALNYGVSAEQLTERQALQENIRTILSQNRLVGDKRTLRSVQTTAPPAAGASASAAEETEADAEMNELTSMQGALNRSAEMDTGMDRGDAAGFAASASKPASPESMPAQAAFDRLSEAVDTSNAVIKQKTAKVKDLNLDDSLRQRSLEKADQPALKKEAALAEKRTVRKERSILPEPVSSPSYAARSGVRMFESEIDPIEIGLLDSGHFIFFRKVWRDGKRHIQGALINQQDFINGTIDSMFRDAPALSHMSNLIVAWQGNVLSTAGADYAGYSAGAAQTAEAGELQGSVLHKARLSAPLGNIELLFTITRLPAGPGGRVIGWMAVIMLLVLGGGMLLMYRLGLRQIDLTHQQQDFVSAVSHELKTPLTSIRMYGEILKQGWADEDKKKTYYDFIFDESERLSRLINNVLQLARMTRNDLTIASKPVAVSVLMDNVRSKVATQIERAGFELNLTCSADTGAAIVEMDADLFAQIVINLVDNAIKFSAKSARKAIDIHCARQSDNTVLFSVRDYGPGIKKDQLKRIFKLFYRPENELTRETIGTGIGLALVRQLAQAMRGQVDVINREPGAEFRVIFPVRNSS
jgi:two-component system phosphate regulon sensor histidine kinase PhoR